jgi:hypothetical protein
MTGTLSAFRSADLRLSENQGLGQNLLATFAAVAVLIEDTQTVGAITANRPDGEDL